MSENNQPQSQTTVGNRPVFGGEIAQERERCARIAESFIKTRGGARWALDEQYNEACEEIAAAIRAGVQK